MYIFFNLKYIVQFFIASSDYGYGIAVDSSGNSYATGAFFLTVDFGGGAVTSAGGADFYVLKLNSLGGGIE
tara:strand:- start:442 stop:654 length:213 start_codon:yes stop_codon:yes gene_type:complete